VYGVNAFSMPKNETSTSYTFPFLFPCNAYMADLIIEEKIEKVIYKHKKWGKIWDWVRLVDDTLAGWESKEEFQEFFTYLNTIHSGIQWTCEMEEEGKLPIFDILIIRSQSGVLDTTVYRKPSASSRYIHYTSAQAWKEKVSAIQTLKKRAVEYCSNKDLLSKELELLLRIFQQNGYPKNIVWRILYKESSSNKEKANLDFSRIFYAPYHPRARRLHRILEEKFATQTIYSKTKTLGDLLKKKVRKPDKIHTKNAVYQIPCSKCEVTYIGQTKKTIQHRMTQHKNKCNEMNLTKLRSDKQDNGVAVHHARTGHSFAFGEVKILAEEVNYWRRLIKEGLEIKKRANLANLKSGYNISEIWNPFLDIG
jgi:hypothetical protein